ncbi:hypothetical protein ACHAW5_003218 [Stephanodiscus triporus]|uniref:Uncharacterized protein n=1 Tax=Stephanodiscus triporus TaxID=2934178 RepID=A0ABD3N6Y7_9STRA
MMEQSRRMRPPLCKVDGVTTSPKSNSYVVHVSWKPYEVEGGEDGCVVVLGYNLQMRKNISKSSWATVGPLLTRTEVKKKNLTSGTCSALAHPQGRVGEEGSKFGNKRVQGGEHRSVLVHKRHHGGQEGERLPPLEAP